MAVEVSASEEKEAKWAETKSIVEAVAEPAAEKHVEGEGRDLEYEASEALVALASGLAEVPKDLKDLKDLKEPEEPKEAKAAELAPMMNGEQASVQQQEEEEMPKFLNSDHCYCLPQQEDCEQGYPLREATPPLPAAEPTTPQRGAKSRKSWSAVERFLSEVPLLEPLTSKAFAKRNVVQEMNILYEFLRTGVDAEDVQYLKRSYDAMLQDEVQGCWLNDTHWVDHPPTNIPNPSKKKKKEETRVHLTGCARSEGYYKMDVREKARYKQSGSCMPQHENQVG